MKTKEFGRMVLEGLQLSLERVLEGLTPAEIAWQPAPSLNPMGLILFHTARSEDFFIQELVRRQPQVWERDEWYIRFNLPKGERGRHYKAEQVDAFISPDIGHLRSYNAAVREETLNYLDGLAPEDFHRVVTTPRGERTVAGFFSNIVSHTAQHLGEMSYLRG